MVASTSDAVARKAQCGRDDAAGDKPPAKDPAALAKPKKRALEAMARSSREHVLELLGYEPKDVQNWVSKPRSSKFISAEEKAEFDAFKLKQPHGEFFYLDEKGKRQVAKLGFCGNPKKSLIEAWRKNKDLRSIE